LTGQEPHSPRKGLIYFDDDGSLVALRYDNWKLVFTSAPTSRQTRTTIRQYVRRVPTAAEGGQLHHRRCASEDE